MRIKSKDLKKSIDIEPDIWYSVYSTAEKRLGAFEHKVSLAMAFLKNGECTSGNALETAREFNLIRDEFSKYTPDKAIYDMRDLGEKAPWEGNLSPVVTSCANLYTTSDGKDLLFEVVSLLTYAHYAKTSVITE